MGYIGRFTTCAFCTQIHAVVATHRCSLTATACTTVLEIYTRARVSECVYQLNDCPPKSKVGRHPSMFPPEPGPEPDRTGTGTGPESEPDRNRTGTEPEPDRNMTRTGLDLERTGTGRATTQANRLTCSLAPVKKNGGFADGNSSLGSPAASNIGKGQNASSFPGGARLYIL